MPKRSSLSDWRSIVPAGYWQNSTGEWISISSVEDKLQAFPLSRGQLATTPASETAMTFTYPGVIPVITSHGDSDSIVWALENFSGVLHAFSATDLGKELYIRFRGERRCKR